MATFNKFDDLTAQLLRGDHDFVNDTFKIALTNTAPSGTETTFNTTLFPAPTTSNGYAATETVITIEQTSGTTTVAGSMLVFTATGGEMGPFRYAVLYNETSSRPLGWYDYAESVTLQDGENFTVQFNDSDPGTIFTLT